ncbi:MAG: hypothetical protein GXY07_19270 [Candidatus Hydrogenedentes bacterium]|nr:hypothetical protein [Candidatus Hydrogenedentota bacterium]
MIPGYTPFFKTQTVAKIANIQPEMPETADIEPNISNISNALENKNTDVEAIIERSAIRKYDGDLLRDRANMEASAAYDRNRQSYEQANPGRDPRNVEALYRAYIQRWMPDHKGDLPATPPNTRGNEGLWRAWWRRVEGGCHA